MSTIKTLKHLLEDAMQNRNELIAQDYLDGMTVPSLAIEYGLSESRIWQILHEKDVIGKRDMIDKGVSVEVKPLTGVHEVLGRRLSEFELDNMFDGRELSKRLNWSAKKLFAMKRGRKDPTLTELLEISRLFKIPIGEILNECGA